MVTPTFTLPTSGSDPKRATKEGLEYNINQIIQYLDDARISGDAALMSGLEFQGDWDASTNTFPNQNKDGGTITKGDFFWVSVEGTFGGNTYSVNEPLVATTDNPSTTNSSDWYHAPINPSLIPIIDTINTLAIPFDTHEDLKADTTTITEYRSRYGESGKVFAVVNYPSRTLYMDLTQVGSGDVTTAGGVKFSVAPDKSPYGANGNQGSWGLETYRSSHIILGDSISEGVGAGSFTDSFAWQLSRSLINVKERRSGDDTGFRHTTIINQGNAVQSGSYSHNGTILSAGITGERILLTSGQKITITDRAHAFVYVVVDADNSTATDLIFKLNGDTYSTQAVSGTGLQVITANSSIKDFFVDDTLEVESVGGEVVVCGVLTLRSSLDAPLVYVAANSGKAYQDFNDSDSLDELAFWAELFRSGAPHHFIFALGTNNLYNGGRARTPDDMVLEIESLIAGINSRVSSNPYYTISIPPKSNESIFPIISAGYDYEDYVQTLLEFARNNNYGVIRHDLTPLGEGRLLSDGVHPNSEGHRAMVQTACAGLGLDYDREIPSTGNSGSVSADVVPNDSWEAFSGTANLLGKVFQSDGIITMTGIMQPSGSTSQHICTLPVGFRPVGRSSFVTLTTSAGSATATIGGNGNITLSGTIPSWVSFEGIALKLET